MARPTSLSLSAGASLVPSPVTATTSPCCFSSDTSVSLSSGEERASTWARQSGRGERGVGASLAVQPFALNQGSKNEKHD